MLGPQKLSAVERFDSEQDRKDQTTDFGDNTNIIGPASLLTLQALRSMKPDFLDIALIYSSKAIACYVAKTWPTARNISKIMYERAIA